MTHGVYDPDGARALDEIAAGVVEGGSLALMRRAGGAAYARLREQWPAAERVLVCCGGGNNGGDGFVVAYLARRAGLRVEILQVGGQDRFSEQARACLADVESEDIPIHHHLESFRDYDVVVDAIFGIGLSRDVQGVASSVIDAINASAVPVLSLDVPSGLHAATGQVLGCAVHATTTVTFICDKQGLLTGEAPDYVGELLLDDLAIPDEVFAQVPSFVRRFDEREVAQRLPRRSRTAHKGSHGHVLLVGGAPGYSGAIRLAGEAAGRAGAGLISIAVHPETDYAVFGSRPELMVHACSSADDLRSLSARASVIGIGPGLGRSAWAQQMLASVLEIQKPLVVDADALNLLAAEPCRRAHWILTPHPGEAARLLNTTTEEIAANRFSAAQRLAEMFDGTIVLKGSGSLVQHGELTTVITAGNPGMGSGGMGDVLSGVLCGLLAQGLPAAAAARIGCWAHATAADRAADASGERGLLALDLMTPLRHLLNPA